MNAFQEASIIYVGCIPLESGCVCKYRHCFVLNGRGARLGCNLLLLVIEIHGALSNYGSDEKPGCFPVPKSLSRLNSQPKWKVRNAECAEFKPVQVRIPLREMMPFAVCYLSAPFVSRPIVQR